MKGGGIFVTLLSFIITLVLIVVWFQYFEKSEQDFVKTNFVVQTHNFVEAVQLVHLEWLLLGKPSEVAMGQLNDIHYVNVLRLNLKGRPKLQSNDTSGCQLLWQALLGLPLKSLKKSINVVYKINNKQQVCEYSIKSEVNVKFEYFIQTGQAKFIS